MEKTEKLDYKKAYRDLYLPTTKPVLVDVPEMRFIAVDGTGDPNSPDGEYTHALQTLYSLSFAIKMSKMGHEKPKGYFEYVMPPLEGLWWTADDRVSDFSRDKSLFLWTSMIRQPEFVTHDVFDWARSQVQSKKPEIDISKARLMTLTEGLCVQCMHIGPYDDEPATIAKIDAFIEQNGLASDMAGTRRHHEIYLGDPRKGAPEKRRTVLRHPVRQK